MENTGNTIEANPKLGTARFAEDRTKVMHHFRDAYLNLVPLENLSDPEKDAGEIGTGIQEYVDDSDNGLFQITEEDKATYNHPALHPGTLEDQRKRFRDDTIKETLAEVIHVIKMRLKERV